MDVRELNKYIKKPKLYEKGSKMMWTEPTIQQYLLEAHLSQDTEAASRTKINIERTIAWIFSNESRQGISILDLGCGPGLYVEKMAEMRHHVTGMDFSSHSLNHAKKSAEQKLLPINYVLGNYLEDTFPDNLDLICIIYCDFGVLSMKEQNLLLEKAYDSLRPGGKFIVDAYNLKLKDQLIPKQDFESVEKGFWRDHPYLCLSETFLYPEANAFLDQHVVIDNTIETYRFYNHYYSEDDMIKKLEEVGFSQVAVGRDVISDPTVSFYKCIKQA